MRTLVIAPHPDDELLGCGGTLLRRKHEGASLAWLIVTGISTSEGWGEEKVAQREKEIDLVGRSVGFDRVYKLNLPTTRLDAIPMADLVGKFSEVFKDFEPEEVFVPHRCDVHTDHRIVFDASAACTKWFRYPSVKKVCAYETVSETEFGGGGNGYFHPNCYVDISLYLERKIELLSIYRSEMDDFPFPRSFENLRALARYRGASSGFNASEAFQILSERS